MASAYQPIANTLNAKFKDKTKVKAAALDFQNKHGPKGHGEGGKKPYRFGNFAGYDGGVVGPNEQAKWLIDTGVRNWDSTVADLQDTIRNNLSDTGPQVPMKFSIQADGGIKARAEITPIKDGAGNLVSYEIILHCRD
jgi:hypothetical protein